MHWATYVTVHLALYQLFVLASSKYLLSLLHRFMPWFCELLPLQRGRVPFQLAVCPERLQVARTRPARDGRCPLSLHEHHVQFLNFKPDVSDFLFTWSLSFLPQCLHWHFSQTRRLAARPSPSRFSPPLGFRVSMSQGRTLSQRTLRTRQGKCCS